MSVSTPERLIKTALKWKRFLADLVLRFSLAEDQLTVASRGVYLILYNIIYI